VRCEAEVQEAEQVVSRGGEWWWWRGGRGAGRTREWPPTPGMGSVKNERMAGGSRREQNGPPPPEFM